MLFVFWVGVAGVVGKQIQAWSVCYEEKWNEWELVQSGRGLGGETERLGQICCRRSEQRPGKTKQ